MGCPHDHGSSTIPGVSTGILIRHAVLVPAPMDDVYVFTQDFDRRSTWDLSIRTATVLDTSPDRRVRVRIRGGHEAVLVYRTERAESEHGAATRATSVAMTEVRSWLLQSGGGVWTYEDRGAATHWTQVMRVQLRRRFLTIPLRPLVAWTLRREVRRSMSRVVALFAIDRAHADRARTADR